MMNEEDFTAAIAQAVAQILSLAEEQGFSYPLHIVTTSADEQEIVYLYPAKGELPTVLFERLAEGASIMLGPFEVAVHEWDTASGKCRERELRARIDNRLEVEVEAEADDRDAPTRSTADLIRELEEESRKHLFAAIAVSFEDTTIWVLPHDPDRLKVLNEAVSVGGIPIGLIAADQSDRELTVMRRVYPEHVHKQQEASEYLDRLTEEVAELIRQQHGEGG